jgi:N6-L-threonylcarbamoyladenine synthase
MRASVAASYQLAICRHLEDRLALAVQKYPDTKEIHLVGGVSANTRLRSVIGALGKKHGVAVRHPEELRYCTDNGAMIASAGHFLTMEKPTMSGTHFETCATVSLSDVVDPISTGAR